MGRGGETKISLIIITMKDKLVTGVLADVRIPKTHLLTKAYKPSTP